LFTINFKISKISSIFRYYLQTINTFAIFCFVGLSDSATQQIRWVSCYCLAMLTFHNPTSESRLFSIWRRYWTIRIYSHKV